MNRLLMNRLAYLQAHHLDEILSKIDAGFVDELGNKWDTPEHIYGVANEVVKNFKVLFFSSKASKSKTVTKMQFDNFWSGLKERYEARGGKDAWPSTPYQEWSAEPIGQPWRNPELQ